MSRSRKGPRLGGNQVFWHLKRNGPTGVNKIQGGSSNIGADAKRLYDIRTFRPGGTNPNTSAGVPQGATVLYLGEYHDEEAVVREWLDANKNTLSQRNITQSAITQSISGGFKDAWRKICDGIDYIDNPHAEFGGMGGPKERGCPLCGESVESLGRHLRHDCPGTKPDGGDQ